MRKLPDPATSKIQNVEAGLFFETEHTPESLNNVARLTCKTCWGKGYVGMSLDKHYKWNQVCDCVNRAGAEKSARKVAFIKSTAKITLPELEAAFVDE